MQRWRCNLPGADAAWLLLAVESEPARVLAAVAAVAALQPGQVCQAREPLFSAPCLMLEQGFVMDRRHPLIAAKLTHVLTGRLGLHAAARPAVLLVAVPAVAGQKGEAPCRGYNGPG